MKLIKLIIIIILFPVVCFSTPASVTPSSTTFTDGGSIDITGTGFTTNDLDIDYLHDNIEAGTDGEAFAKTDWVNKVTTPDADNVPVLYSNTKSHSGTKSLKIDYNGTPYKGNMSYDPGSTISSMYITWWVRAEWAGITSGQWKIWRFTYDRSAQDSYPGFVQSSWSTGARVSHNFQESSLDNTWCTGSCTGWAKCNPCAYPNNSSDLLLGSDDVPGPNAIEDRWVRMEYWIGIGTRGGTDGQFYYWLHDPDNGSPVIRAVEELQFSGVQMLDSDGGSRDWRYPMLGVSATDGGLGDFVTYWDDVYVQVGMQSRVEIGNASTWDTCTHREIQKPTAWNASGEAITVTINQGSFGEETAYLYVVDENGVPNATGTEITFGVSTSPTVALTGSGTTVEVNTAVTIQGTATATAGRTISTIASPGITVTCDDGTCDELEEAFSAESGTLNLGLNSFIFTATDSSAETGQGTFTITYTPAGAECDADHFWLCETQTPCESAGHNWWDDSCKTITEPTDWTGNNLLVNSDFTSWTTGDPDSWNVSDSAKVFEDTYGCQLTNNGTISQKPPLVDGTTYRYVIDLVEIIEGQFEVYYYDTSVTYNALETITATFTLGTVPDHWIYFKAPTGSNEVVINNIILKEVSATGEAVTGSSGTTTVGSTGISSIGSAP